MFSDNATVLEAINCTLDIETIAPVEVRTEENCNNTGESPKRAEGAADVIKIGTTNKTESDQIQKYIIKAKQEEHSKSKKMGHYKNILKRKKRATPGIFHPHPALATFPLRIIAEDDFDPLGYDSIVTTPRPVIKENLKATAPQVFPEFTPLPRLPPGTLERYNVSTESKRPNPNKDTDIKEEIKTQTPATQSKKNELFNDGNSYETNKNKPISNNERLDNKYDDDDTDKKFNIKPNFKYNNDETYPENDYENIGNSPSVRNYGSIIHQSYDSEKATKKPNHENANKESNGRFKPYDTFENNKSGYVRKDKDERNSNYNPNTANDFSQHDILEKDEISSTPVPRAINQNEKYDDVKERPGSNNFRPKSKLNYNPNIDDDEPDDVYDKREKVQSHSDEDSKDHKKYEDNDEYRYNKKPFNNKNNLKNNKGRSLRRYKTADKLEDNLRDDSDEDGDQDEDEEVEYKPKSVNLNSNHQIQTDPGDSFKPYEKFDKNEKRFPKLMRQEEESDSEEELPRSNIFSSKNKLHDNSYHTFRPYDASLQKEKKPSKSHDDPAKHDREESSSDDDEDQPQRYNMKPKQELKNTQNLRLYKTHDNNKKETNIDRYQEENDEQSNDYSKHRKISDGSPRKQGTYTNEEGFNEENTQLPNLDSSDESKNNNQDRYKQNANNKIELDLAYRHQSRSNNSHNYQAFDPNEKSKIVRSKIDQNNTNEHNNDDDKIEEDELLHPHYPRKNKIEDSSEQNVFVPESSSISDGSDDKYIINDSAETTKDRFSAEHKNPNNFQERSEINDDSKTYSKPRDNAHEIEKNESYENTHSDENLNQNHKKDETEYERKPSADDRYSEGYQNYHQDEDSSENNENPKSSNSNSDTNSEIEYKIPFIDVDLQRKKYYPNDDKFVRNLHEKNEDIYDTPQYVNKEKLSVEADSSAEEISKESFDKKNEDESDETSEEKINVPEKFHQSYYPKSIDTDTKHQIEPKTTKHRNSQLNDNLDPQTKPRLTQEDNFALRERNNNPEISYEIHHPLQNSEEYPNKLPRTSHGIYDAPIETPKDINGKYISPEVSRQSSNIEKEIRNRNIEYETYHPRENTKLYPEYKLANLNLSIPDSRLRSEISYNTYHPRKFGNEYKKHKSGPTLHHSKHRIGSILPKPYETNNQRRDPDLGPTVQLNSESVNTSEDAIQSNEDGARNYNSDSLNGLKDSNPTIKSTSKSYANLPNDNTKHAELPDLTLKTPEGNVKQQFEKIPLDYMHDARKLKQGNQLKNNKLQQTESNEEPSPHPQNEENEGNRETQDESENEEKVRVEYDPESEVKFGDLDLPVIKLPESVLGYYDTTEDDESDIQINRKENIQDETNADETNADEEDVEDNENNNEEEAENKGQNYKEAEDDLYGKFFSDDNLYESFVRDHFNKKGNFVEQSQKNAVEPNYENPSIQAQTHSSKSINKVNPTPDLYENFVHNSFDKKGTFAERSQKITIDPILKETMQDVLQHVSKSTRGPEKSKDPKYGYMWTLNYGRPL